MLVLAGGRRKSLVTSRYLALTNLNQNASCKAESVLDCESAGSLVRSRCPPLTIFGNDVIANHDYLPHGTCSSCWFPKQSSSMVEVQAILTTFFSTGCSESRQDLDCGPALVGPSLLASIIFVVMDSLK